MRIKELKSQIALGEDSIRQFKADVRNAESLASEMAAFANSEGGVIFLGVADDGSIPGLDKTDISRLLPCHGLGSGIKRALADWPQIDFADDRDGCLFTATVHRKSVSDLALADKGALKVQIKGQPAPINAPVTDFQVQLLGIIQANPAISYDNLAKLTEKDRTTVMRNIGKLKYIGILKRVGSRKTGHWEVSE